MKKIKLKIGFKGELTTENILGDLNFAIENGFNCLEIKVRCEEDFHLKTATIKQIRKVAEKNNVFLGIHPSPFLPISSPFPEIARGVIRVAEKSIILATNIKADYLVFHSGFKEVAGPAIAKNCQTLVKNLKEIVKLGKSHGIKIALENSSKYSNAVCIKVEDLLKVVNAVKGLNILFDVGHANTANSDPIKYFKQVKDFVINIHIHDNDGSFDQHALIGEGNIDFKGLLRECKNSGYYGPFTLEVSPYENILKGREIFLNLWNQI